MKNICITLSTYFCVSSPQSVTEVIDSSARISVKHAKVMVLFFTAT